MTSLWGEEFEITEKKKEKKVIDKINKASTKTVVKRASSKKLSIPDQINIIRQEVQRILGKYQDNTLVIRNYSDFVSYIDKAVSNNLIVIDTETNNSLDPISCKLMGLCLYTPGLKQAYIPVNHTDYQDNKLDNQITEAQIKEQLSRIVQGQIIMHNGKFDYEVIKCTCDIEVEPTWDTMIGARILNELERAGLKEQYISKIDSSQEKYDIENLFEHIPYNYVEPELFALYAATDSYMTYKLYQYQKQQFDLPDHKKLFSLFKDIEMPVVKVCAEMELAGIEIDQDYAKRLSSKYHKQSEAVELEIQQELTKYSKQISDWRQTKEANYHPPKKTGDGEGKSKSEQLADPPQISSPTQLSILLYDILKVTPPNKEKPRATGEPELSKMDLPLCKLILKKRGLDKLISTYIDKLPACVSPIDNRLHAHFNQIGADTGRFSSSDPNLQNIPSHSKDIRLLFKAADGCILVGSDFSQQEPRLLSMYSQDENMMNAYKEGKDLYATIASGVYKNSYWDNMEHHQDGTANPEGKKRRSNCKSLLLGIMYGRGAASIAEQIGSDYNGAQKIVDDFYSGFPKVKSWMDRTEQDASINGYVEDFWGRRRRLPDIQLEEYVITSPNGSSDFNPLLYTSGNSNKQNDTIEGFKKQLSSARSYKEVNTIKSSIRAAGFEVRDNGGFIAQAKRQCVNSRVQGGAASMSKIAMRKVFDNQELKNLGFKILIQVHDELIGECPKENSEKVAEILTEVMKHCAEPTITVPFKCDATIEKSWYYTDYSDQIKEEFQEILKNGFDRDSALQKLSLNHEELTENQLKEMLEII